MKITTHILRSILAILTFLTGYYMLQTLDFSETALVDNGWSTWLIAPYIIRIVSGLFMFTGLVLILGLNQSKKMLIWPFGLFLFSSFFQCSIIWQIELDRCYLCLRELFQWNIYQGIVLGSIGLGLTILLYNLPQTSFNWKFRFPVVLILFLTSISYPFILNYPASWAVYGESEFDYWEQVVNDKSNMDDTNGDTYKATYDFSIPPIQYLEKLTIPVLICYGTKDWSAPYNDYLRMEMLRQKKKNFTFKAYIGLEHNFFPLTTTGQPNYDTSNWDIVANEWWKWTKLK
jgi:hypothetical protein